MIYIETKLDWDDISIVPDLLSGISSRSEISNKRNGKLPLFTAPMDKVIDESNVKKFEENNINVCLPRHVKYDNLKNDSYFYSYGLDEICNIVENEESLPKKVLIDIANGHMNKLLDISKKIKETYDVTLMVGNIANPDTYRLYCQAGIDFIRVGIGAGNVCTTSANTSVHYPLASLISECADIKKEFLNPTKIIADGGFNNFSDIIKALGIGADYVMLGSIFNKSLESCGDNFTRKENMYGKLEYTKIEEERLDDIIEQGIDIYKYYRGMSTKEVQKTWNKKKLTTSEGISKYNKVEYRLDEWCENFSDYLKSAMSYTHSYDLGEFIGNINFVKISVNAFNRFNK